MLRQSGISLSALQARWIIIALLSGIAANALLILNVPLELHAVGATLLVFVLPGTAWMGFLFPRSMGTTLSERIVLSIGTSVALSILLLWCLFLLPVRLQFQALLGALDVMILLLTALAAWKNAGQPAHLTVGGGRADRGFAMALAFIFAVGLFYTLAGLPFLGYVGDERTVISIVLDILMDKKTALFDLTKGPAQVLLATWFVQLTDSWWEGIVRLPFAFCAVAAAACFTLIARFRLPGPIAVLTGLLLVLDGLILGLSRWAQYQMLALLMMHLALYCSLRGWATRDTGKSFRYWLLCACFWAVGLLAHYDAVLIGPAMLYLFLFTHRRLPNVREVWLRGASLALVILALGLPFYVLLALQPGTAQALQGYLVDRIAPTQAPFNHLRSFFFQIVYYDSSYQAIGILLLVLLALVVSAARYARTKRKADLPLAVLGISMLATLYVIWEPTALTVAGVNLSVVPVVIASALLIGKVIRDPYWRLVSIWGLAVFAFTGFFMTDPRDHFFGGMPPLLLIAGKGLSMIVNALRGRYERVFNPWIARGIATLVLAWLALGAVYVYLLDVAHYPVVLGAHPERVPALFADLGRPEVVTPWVPDNGWRVIAVLYERGELRGEYDSALIRFPDWYLHRIWWPPQSSLRYYFDIGPFAVDTTPPNLAETYDLWGTVTVEGEPRLRIYQRKQGDPSPVPRTVRTEDYEQEWQQIATLARLEKFKADQRDDSAFYAISRDLLKRGQTGDAIVFDNPEARGILSLYYTGDLPYLDIRANPDLKSYRRIWGIFWGAGDGAVELTLAEQTYASGSQWFGNSRLALYGVAADKLQRMIQVEFSDVATLVSGAELPPELHAGDLLPLALTWRAKQIVTQRYKVFVHIADDRGKPLAQTDVEPMAGLSPTNTWRAGEKINDQIGVWLSPDMPKGRYQVLVGMYDPLSGARVDAVSSSGERFPNDAVPLGTFVVE
jgi:Dolichyl-phosphate-mannose-protein mannosyltransferase